MKEKIREIKITEVTNGYLVEIGCCVFVFKQDELLEELAQYIKEPRKTETRYMKEYRLDDIPVSGVQPQEPSVSRGRGFVASHASLLQPEGSRMDPQ